MAKENIVRKIFIKKLKLKPLSIKSFKTSSSNEVFDVKTDKGSFILKLTKSPAYIKNTKVVMESLYKKNIIKNKVVFYDDSKKILKHEYIIIEKLDGNTLFELKDRLSKENIRRILSDAVRVSKKISEKKLDKLGFGMFSLNMQHFESEVEFILNEFNKSIEHLKKFFTTDEISKLYQTITKHFDLFKGITPRLIYQDLTFKNIIVKDGRFNGLIDFEWLFSGDYVRGYALLYYVTKKSKYEKLVKDLIKLDKSETIRMKIYALLTAFRSVIYKRRGRNYAGLNDKKMFKILLSDLERSN